MSSATPLPVLRVGFIGSGFIAAFHLQSMVGVRNVVVTGIYSRSADKREKIAALANSLGLGPAKAFDSIEAMVMSGTVDALWIMTPNDTRLPVMREIHRLAKAGAPLSRCRLREAPRPHARGKPGDAGAGRGCRAVAWLSREPAVLDSSAARQGHRLAPRGAAGRPSLSRPRG